MAQCKTEEGGAGTEDAHDLVGDWERRGEGNNNKHVQKATRNHINYLLKKKETK